MGLWHRQGTSIWQCWSCHIFVHCCQLCLHSTLTLRQLAIRQISWWHINMFQITTLVINLHVSRATLKVYRLYTSRSILCQSRENKKKRFRINQYAIRSAVRSALRRCMGKQNELLRIGKTLTGAWFSLADRNCTQRENFRKCGLEFWQMYMSNFRDRNRNQKSDAFNWWSVFFAM
jgi:hypothetical protein